jgi:hypothetical protein
LVKPSQEVHGKSENIAVITNADIEAAVAWNNRMIVLDRADIHAILRSISRKYYVEVQVGKLEGPEFISDLPRKLTLDRLVETVEINGN